MRNCVFCKIINGEIPAYVISENEDITIFLSFENHPLVMPKKHIKDIYALDQETGKEIIKGLVDVAKTVKKALRCDGIYVAQANEPAAGQDVFHIHFHVIPCWQGQKMNLRERVDDRKRSETFKEIKMALKK